MTGVFCVFLFNMVKVSFFGINKGLVALLANAVVMAIVSLMATPDAKAIERWILTLKSDRELSSAARASR